MSKRKAPVITYEDVVQNILAFIENDDIKDELDPLFENQSDDDEFEIEENDTEENLIDDEEEVEVPEQEEELNPRRNRKLLTRNRLVRDINSALDKNNYDPIHYINGNGHWETLTGYLGPKTNKKTETITWTSTLPSQAGRQRRCDVITEQISCLKGAARNVTSKEDCFDLFFSDGMFELITPNTNKRIDAPLDKLRTFKGHTFNSSKYTWLKHTTKEELEAFIGLVYFMPLYGMNHHNIEFLSKSGIGPDIFGATMSQQGVRFLLAHIAFHDKSRHKDR